MKKKWGLGKAILDLKHFKVEDGAWLMEHEILKIVQDTRYKNTLFLSYSNKIQITLTLLAGSGINFDPGGM